MSSQNNFKKVIIAVTVLGFVSVLFFTPKLSFHFLQSTPVKTPVPTNTTEAVTVVSASPLNNSTILPTQSVSLTFNRSALNGPELKIRIDPSVSFEVNLSNYNKTVTISFPKPLALGQGYTLFIPAEAKFEGGKTLGQDYSYYFATISYQGV